MIGPFYFTSFGEEILMTNDTGRFIFLSHDDFDVFSKGDLASLSAEVREALEAGLFCSSGSDEAFISDLSLSLRDADSYLFQSTNLFILAITNECNNRCVYCQANGNAKPHIMSLTVADKILDRIAECPSSYITIEFQGGEPLINYPVVQHVVIEAKKRLADKHIQFALVSNLSCLTDEMALFLKENNVSVSTSLDGPADLHDKNRPTSLNKGSYAETMRGLEILKHYDIQPGAIQTTTAASLTEAERIVDEYARLGFSQIFLRPLTRLGAAARCWTDIGYTPKQFLAFYRQALRHIMDLNLNGTQLTEYHAALFLSKILNNKSVNYMELRSPCGAAIGQVAFTWAGDVYTCDEGRMISETGDYAFRLGNVFENGYNEWMESSCCKSVCSASLLDSLPGCCDCVYKPYCGVCPVVNYAINGSITAPVRSRCEIYHGILDILYKYIHNGIREEKEILEKWSFCL